MGIDKWVCLTVIFYTPQHGNVAISLTDKYEYAKMMTEREKGTPVDLGAPHFQTQMLEDLCRSSIETAV